MIILSDYQLTSYNWLKQNKKIILADSPGCGKTHPAIFAAKDIQGLKLIVCPAYLSVQWEVELNNCNETDIVMINGSVPVTERLRLFDEKHLWTITSYEMFLRNGWLERFIKHFSVAIFDEAHRLRNRNSKRTVAAIEFCKTVPNAYFLTGTPLVNNGGDIFPLLKIIDKKKFSSYWKFVNEHCYTTTNPFEVVVGKPRNKEEFNKLLQPYMLRRELKEVLPNIPDVVEKIIYIDLSASTRKEYTTLKKEYKITHLTEEERRVSFAGLASELRGLTFNNKIEALKDLIEDIPQEDNIVIFTWHRELCNRLKSELVNSQGFNGSDKIEFRQDIIKLFQKNSFRILIATLATLTEGVNLQNANTAVFLEHDWLSVTQEQAIARLHRRGQDNTVKIYHIVTRNTIDQSVYRVQSERAEMTLNAVYKQEMKGE